MDSQANPLLAILIYALGGLSGASFYLLFSGVKKWAWESYWLIYAVGGLLLAPWVLAMTMAPNTLSVLRATPWETLGLCFMFGAMWGAGGITWGLMVRYLGVGLGVAIGCGLCASVGTLVPPLVQGDFQTLAAKPGGSAALIALLVGVGVSLVGIVFTGAAGMSKEREMSEEQKKASVAEFNFTKGMIVAIFSGVMSAGMAFGVRTASSAAENMPSIVGLAETISPATNKIWAGLPGLTVILLGGFTVNFLWSYFLNLKNGTTGDYVKSDTPLTRNYILAALAGIVWYLQMVCFTMGDSKIGDYKFSGWSIFMSAQIIFSTLWGIALLEWKGASARTKRLLFAGLAILVASLVVIGYGNYLAELASQKAG